MRCMLGLDRPERGTDHVRRQGVPARTPSRSTRSARCSTPATCTPAASGRNHLRWLAASNGISAKRVDEVLALVGLTIPAGRRVRTYSLGMRQRLGLAGVLLGDPHTIILDEPANGLDPEGIRWIRDVLTHLAGAGAHGVRQQPPAVGDGADGHRPRRHRPGPADRAVHGRRVRRPLGRPLGEGAQPAGRRRRPGAGRRRRPRRARRRRGARGARRVDRGRRRAGRPQRLACCTSCRRRPARWRTRSSRPRRTPRSTAASPRPAPRPAPRRHRPTGRCRRDRRAAQRVDQAAHDPDELGPDRHRRGLPAGRLHPHHRAAEGTGHQRQGRRRPGLGHVGRHGAAARRHRRHGDHRRVRLRHDPPDVRRHAAAVEGDHRQGDRQRARRPGGRGGGRRSSPTPPAR